MKELSMEDKNLLLKDLCARLPYGVNVKCPLDVEPYTLLSINWNKEIVVIGFIMDGMLVTSKQKLANVRPYLRSMSSMTEEENEEFEELFIGYSISQDRNCVYHSNRGDLSVEVFDWLNEHHFDYRTDDEGKTMIEKGLALEASKGMYNIK